MGIVKRLAGSKYYYGWVIVGVSLLSMAFWIGFRSSFSVFYVALLEEFHWSRGDSAGVQSLALIVYMILAPIVGTLIDRFGPRKVIVPGIFVLGLGLCLCSLIGGLLQFYLIYGIIAGAGVTCIGIVSYSAIIAHWFEKKRGLASGIALSGMGLGTFVFVPLSQQFISMWGWRATFVIIGVIVLIILIPFNGFLLRHKPEDLGLRIDGSGSNDAGKSDGRTEKKTKYSNGIDWTIGKAIRTYNFWAMLTFTSLSMLGIWLIHVHNVRFMVDQGVDKMGAAMAYAMVGIVSSVFRIFWGWISDRIGREIAFSMGMICGSLGILSLILFEHSGSGFYVYSFVLFFGIGWGASAPMFIATAADLFKGRGFGLIYGIVEGGVGVAGAFGAWIGGFIFDKTGSYQGAFIVVIIVMMLSIVAIWVAAPRKAGQLNSL